MFFSSAILLFGAAASAAVVQPLEPRAFSFPIPASKGSVKYSSAQTISGTFDGGMKTYDRSDISCNGQNEGGDKDAVFLLKDGATLQNVIIGPKQSEGVHCLGACTIKNVWWTEVCEDALTIKGNGNALVSGGGARNADDKVIQHNGFGTVTIENFSVQTFGKLYRSCGNCKGNGKARKVVIKGVKASGGKVLVGINDNYGDKATIDSATCATSVKEICARYKGNANGAEPSEVGSGPGGACGYSSVKAC